MALRYARRALYHPSLFNSIKRVTCRLLGAQLTAAYRNPSSPTIARLLLQHVDMHQRVTQKPQFGGTENLRVGGSILPLATILSGGDHLLAETLNPSPPYAEDSQRPSRSSPPVGLPPEERTVASATYQLISSRNRTDN